MPHPRVIGIGAATWDHLCIVPEFPAGEGVQQAIASRFQGGGPVATALCVLAKLGTPAAVLDAQGDDAIGKQIREELKHFGVVTGFIRVQTGASSAHATILVRQRDGARHIMFSPSSAGEFRPEDVPEDEIATAKLIHLNGRHEAACFRAIELAKKHRVPVSFDGGAGRFRGEASRRLVAASSIRILARSFAAELCGTEDIDAMARSLSDSAMNVLVITDGSHGSHVWSRTGENFHQPAFAANPLIDTTGCGDVFHGAFLHGWLQDWPIRKCAEFASKMAAANAEGLGGRFAIERSDLATEYV